jgi:hypothetical protein
LSGVFISSFLLAFWSSELLPESCISLCLQHCRVSLVCICKLSQILPKNCMQRHKDPWSGLVSVTTPLLVPIFCISQAFFLLWLNTQERNWRKDLLLAHGFRCVSLLWQGGCGGTSYHGSQVAKKKEYRKGQRQEITPKDTFPVTSNEAPPLTFN